MGAPASPSIRERLLPWAAMAFAIGIAILIVNPFREFMTEDDGWAYARSVRHLLRTGEYRLDQWSAANMPVQIYLAGGLAKLFGYSLSMLRWSTLTLLCVGLGSFYALLRELGAERLQAAALALGLLASPMVLMLSFTFMSDIQFLGWLLLALWLYVRGINRQQDAMLFLGSLAAACAIGTRQFGIIVIGGWLIAWLFAGKGRRPAIRSLAAALAMPLMTTAWQFLVGLGEPNFTQSYRLIEQRIFVNHAFLQLAREMLWRSAISAQYIGLFLVPLLPLTLGIAWRMGKERKARRFAIIVTLIAGIALALGLALNSHLTVRPKPVGNAPWPALGLIWALPTALWRYEVLQRILDTVAFLGVLPMIWVMSGIGRPLHLIRSAPPAVLLLIGSGLLLFLLQLSYVQLNDTYFVGLLPFAILAIAWRLRETGASKPLVMMTIAGCLAATLVTALWMRRDYERQEQNWLAADRIAQRGVPYQDIWGPKHWAEYHGAFDDWIAAGAPGLSPPPTRLRIGEDPFHDPFYEWFAARNLRAAHKVPHPY